MCSEWVQRWKTAVAIAKFVPRTDIVARRRNTRLSYMGSLISNCDLKIDALYSLGPSDLATSQIDKVRHTKVLPVNMSSNVAAWELLTQNLY